MKKIWGYITTHYREECNKKYLLVAMLFCTIMLFINYRYDFEYTYLKPDFNWWSRVAKYTAMYGLAFGGAYLLQILADPKDRSLRSGKLWGLVVMAVILFSVRAAFFQQSYLVNKYVSFALQTVAYKCVANLVGFTFLFIPCAIYWFFTDRKNQPLYGFHAKGVDLKPYFGLILLMVPALLWAGQQADFLTVYPRAAFLNMPPDQPFRKIYTFLYEVCYSSDYIVTEFFFRGFLILAFARFIGYKAIIPMCVFYVTIHFDKPLGEAISSFFGGYLLGLLVYKTRSIYGGIIVHLGIALLMEVIGLIFHAPF
ncbi:CPBP family intramembrane glutamic endopeptidase [Chitinophagaceae bacterium MMS25-I14]